LSADYSAPFLGSRALPILLDQNAANTALAKIDTECEADRAGPSNKNFRVHTGLAIAAFLIGGEAA
jgi:hypothetical protein